MNADEPIDTLAADYDRTRQAAITTALIEIIEIIAGAKAL